MPVTRGSHTATHGAAPSGGTRRGPPRRHPMEVPVLPRKLKAGLLGTGVMAITAGAFVAVGVADPHDSVTPVLTANQRAAGYAPASRLSPQLAQVAWAQGATKLENPSGIVSFYGY